MSAFLPLARVEASRRRRRRGDARDGGLLRYPAAANNAPAGFLWARPGRATCGFLILDHASARPGFTEPPSAPWGATAGLEPATSPPLLSQLPNRDFTQTTGRSIHFELR